MRFAFVTPRYGAEITQGAEHVCRVLAEQVAERHDVDVLTTCARDSATYANEYPEGVDRVRGVLVRRFAAAAGRDPALRALTERLTSSPHGRADEQEWVRRSGSSSPALFDFLRRQGRSYDALVFFGYSAGTTLQGLAIAPERSVLFPCARVEPALRLYVCQEALGLAAGVGYLSTAERRVVRAYSRRLPRNEEVVGVGVNPPVETGYPRLQQDTLEPEEAAEAGAEPVDSGEPAPHLAGRGVLFRRRQRLHGPYVLHAGPVDARNGTEELLEYFASFAEAGGETPLALMGVKLMKLPQEPWIRSAGVLPNRDLMAALEAADVTVAPDPDDIAGERVLESLAAGTPVLATARSLAAVEHCRRSNGGLYYANRSEFVEALRMLLTDERLRGTLGRNGRRYVQQHHQWDAVVGRFERLVTKARGQKPEARPQKAS